MEVESKGYMNGIQKNEMSECTLNLSLGWSKHGHKSNYLTIV